MATKTTVSITDSTMAKLLQKLEDGNIDEVKKFLREKIEEGRANRLASGKTISVKLALSASALKEGVEAETVEATPIGPFAIHSKGRGSWFVTHVKSGLAAITCVSKRTTAILWAHELEKLLPESQWDREEPLRGLDSDKIRDLREIARKARSGELPTSKAA